MWGVLRWEIEGSGWWGCSSSLLYFPSLFLLTLLPKLISSSGFSAEHLALRRSRGWGSVTFDEWIHLWLTPLLSDCLILTLSISLPPSLVCTLSLSLSLNPLSGLCSSLKTVAAGLIGLCWTLALCCISCDHLAGSLTQTSCEVQLWNIVWTLLSVGEKKNISTPGFSRYTAQMSLSIICKVWCQTNPKFFSRVQAVWNIKSGQPTNVFTTWPDFTSGSESTEPIKT